MKSMVFAFLLATMFGSACSQQSCISGNWNVCATEVAQKITGIYSSYNTWHDHHEQNMFGTTCVSAIKGGFYRWNWRWQGRFWCPQLSSMEGYSNNWKSRQGAIEHAIEDYVRKGGQYGFLTASQMINPLSSQKADASAIDLTGKWNCEDGIYYLRQTDNQLWWYGIHVDGSSWTHVLHGSITGSTIQAKWSNVPPGPMTHGGELTITIENNFVLQRTATTGGFGCTRWTRA